MTKHGTDEISSDTKPEAKALAQLLTLPFWTPAQAQQILQAQAHSGLSVFGFATRHGISASRLYQCRKRLAAPPGSVQAPPPFVPLQVSWPAPDQAEQPPQTGSACWLCLRIPSGAQLRVFAGAPESLVRSVLAALGAPSC
jgi:hypothetical protein